MKTTDAAIAACMDITFDVLIELRHYASEEHIIRSLEMSGDLSLPISSEEIREYILNGSIQFNKMLNCLINDVGDEELKNIVRLIPDRINRWILNYSSYKIRCKKLVNENILIEIFLFLKDTLDFAEKWKTSYELLGLRDLYERTDLAHNVPGEIYLDNKNRLTKHGNLFNN